MHHKSPRSEIKQHHSPFSGTASESMCSRSAPAQRERKGELERGRERGGDRERERKKEIGREKWRDMERDRKGEIERERGREG